nr:MAG TPA: hypothetical protein [Caudoviricetes sp.]
MGGVTRPPADLFGIGFGVVFVPETSLNKGFSRYKYERMRNKHTFQAHFITISLYRVKVDRFTPFYFFILFFYF